MTTNRCCIIVSPYFPPSSVAGVHRARHLAKHLPAAGWKPLVICVDERFHEERLDPELARLVSGDVEISRVAALPARLTRPFGIGEISLRAWQPLRREIFRVLDKRPVQAVLITGSPYYPMLLGGQIQRRFHVPVVLDFQDPWVSAWGADQSVFTKNGITHLVATLLEPIALRSASFVTSVSETQNAQMAERYPWWNQEQMEAIPIGCDSDDFLALDHGKGNPSIMARDWSEWLNLSYVGTFLPRATRLMEMLMRALRRVRDLHPALGSRIRVNFVGTSNQTNDGQHYRVMPLAARAGVLEMVREVPQRIPYLDALSVLAKSDGILMIGSDEIHYTASKIYPGLMSGRPYLSLFHERSSAHELLLAAGGGIALSFGSVEALETMENAICEAIVRLAAEPSTLGHIDRRAYAPYEAVNIARRFACIFEELGAAKHESQRSCR